MTTVRVGESAFAWDELDPRALGGPLEWSHPGLVAAGPGTLRAFDQETGSLVTLDGDGVRLGDALGTPALCGHGFALDALGRTWVADPGRRARLVDGNVIRQEREGAVRLVDDCGRLVTTLGPPPLAAYRDAAFRPTSVAVERPADPGSPVWVADGYGENLVHRLGPDGRHLRTLEGAPATGRFSCPHAVTIDERGPEPSLLVADRGHAVVHRFSLDGRHRATLGGFTTPSGFVASGDLLVVAELRGRLTFVDPDDRLIGSLGDGAAIADEPGWPNVLDGNRTAPRARTPGRFVSPHGIAALADGRLYVAEWRIGGRLVRLTPSVRSAARG